MTEGWGASVAIAGGVTSAFWILMTLGRLTLAGLPITAGTYLRWMPLGLTTCAGLIWFGQFSLLLGAAAILGVGLCASVIFPSLIFQGVQNSSLTTRAKLSGGMLTSAAAGGASGPAAMGVIAGAGALLWIPLPIAVIGIGTVWLARQIAKPESTDTEY